MVYLGLFQTLHEADQSATLAINSLHTALTDPVWQIFSAKKIWFVMYAVILGFFFWNLGWKRALVVTLMCVLTVVFCDQLGNIVKAAVERLRPSRDAFMLSEGLRLLEKPGSMYGFFSAHAANAMGFALSSYLGFKNDKTRSYKYYGWFIVVWAFLVGVSRIFVGKHYLGDVTVGFIVGIVAGTALGLLGRYIIGRFSIPGRR